MKPGFCAVLVNRLTGLVFASILLVACHRPPVRTEQNETNALVGAWQKVSPMECSRSYPDVIEFSSSGIYQTQSEASAVPLVWDSGPYTVDRQIVKISNARDVAKEYRFVIKNGIVTFEDDQGCRFPYRRM
ncbi:hypothetical protein ACFPMF_04475 [Larkinella bovis]|uniref:Lipocalin-like domain-containing protein n=1 Tax=Larkinella bovis TaxID=683041 RepID=A0ABW0I5A3_9BACT